MKTSLEAVSIAYQALAESPVSGMISGGIWKGKRPQNSKLEDIAINALTVTKTPLQRGLINVNIHVQNLEIPGEPIDKTLPNTARLSELGQAVQSVLGDYYTADGKTNLQIESDRVFEDGTNHFLNFRILFYSH